MKKPGGGEGKKGRRGLISLHSASTEQGNMLLPKRAVEERRAMGLI